MSHSIKANLIIYKEDESEISNFELDRLSDRLVEVIEQHKMRTLASWEMTDRDGLVEEFIDNLKDE